MIGSCLNVGLAESFWIGPVKAPKDRLRFCSKIFESGFSEERLGPFRLGVPPLDLQGARVDR